MSAKKICRNCKFRDEHPDISGKYSVPLYACRAVSDQWFGLDAEDKAIIFVSKEGTAADLFVKEDFGCVYWENRVHV